MTRQLSLFAIASFAVFLFSCGGQGGQKTSGGGDPTNKQMMTFASTGNTTIDSLLANELELDLDTCVLDTTIAKNEADDFLTYFKGKNVFTSRISEAIPVSSLYSMFAGINIAGRTDHKYFRALRIYYGYDLNDDLRFVYLPVIADSTSMSGGRINFTLSNSSEDIGDYDAVYIKDGNDFVNIKNEEGLLDDAKEWVNRYKAHIMIKPDTEADWRHYSTDEGDAMGTLFPFQEVFALSSDNGATTVNFFAAATAEPPGPVFRENVVMMVVPGGTGTGMFLAKAANLSGLCPPKCADISYEPK